MEIILQEDYPILGFVGDRVAVKRGFARNYLIPKGIAIEATTRNQKLLKHRLGAINAKKIRLRSDAEKFGEEIGQLKLEFSLKVGEKGKVFGSISTKEIEKALKDKGQEIDRRRIKLLEPIKKPGTYTVEIKLHSEYSTQITFDVLAEHVVTKKEATEGKKGKRRGKKAAEMDEAGEALEASAEDEAFEADEITSEEQDAGEQA
ncbi:MAG: 50S ribosomal protein L9 [Deltaproteobacteria bacterium]|nr:50S ribosomal protein L9 [Deltaproteobacteria bacterium]